MVSFCFETNDIQTFIQRYSRKTCFGHFIFIFNFLKILFIFERERETEYEPGRSRERGRHRIRSRLQALSCQHRAWRGARTHKPWDHDLNRSRMLNQLDHPGAPRDNQHFLKTWFNLSAFVMMDEKSEIIRYSLSDWNTEDGFAWEPYELTSKVP